MVEAFFIAALVPLIQQYTIALLAGILQLTGAGYYIDLNGEAIVKNTIITGNTGPNDVQKHMSSTITDQGYNIIGVQNGTDFDAATDILWSGTQWERNGSALANQNLNLAAALADNGGPTQTLAISAGSFAIGAGDPGLSTDQRGYTRLNPPTIGAYDYGATESKPIPTLGEWGKITFAFLIIIVCGWFVWRRFV